jgi:hypothetical protein
LSYQSDAPQIRRKTRPGDELGLTPEGLPLTKGFRVTGVGSSVSRVFAAADGRYYATGYPIEIQAMATELGYGNSEVTRLPRLRRADQ